MKNFIYIYLLLYSICFTSALIFTYEKQFIVAIICFIVSAGLGFLGAHESIKVKRARR